MTISKDLYLAILSMDAYNRGYGAGIADGGQSDPDGLGETGHIGSATLLTRADIGIEDSQYDAWQAAAFYAVAYDTPYGTVISYRGTDSTPAEDQAFDRAHGWPLGAGNFLGDQTRLAKEFLDAVQDDNAPKSVVLTGHSLGGGLAGFQGRLYGNEAVVFDPMSYLRSADNLLTALRTDPSLFDTINPEFFWDLGLPDVASLSWVRIVANTLMPLSLTGYSQWDMDHGALGTFDNVSGYYIPGEVLDTLLAATALFGINTLREPSLYPKIKAAGGSNWTSLHNQSVVGDVVPGATAPALELHSAGALVLQLFSDQTVIGGKSLSNMWASIHDEVYRAWFGPAVAEAINPHDDATFPEPFAAGTVLSMIAYSALDEGTLVFGNTGIRAMFDDLAELGKRVEDQPAAFDYLDQRIGWASHLLLGIDTRQALTDAIVQFAGEMALRKVDSSDPAFAMPRQGIVGFSADGQIIHNDDPAAESMQGDVLVVDLSANAWDVGKGSETTGAPLSLFRWMTEQLTREFGAYDYSLWAAVPQLAYLREDAAAALTSILAGGDTNRKWADMGLLETHVNSLQLLVNPGQTDVKLAEHDFDPATGGTASLFIADDSRQVVHGTDDNEIFILGGGDDEIFGNGGRDFIFGGVGSDKVTTFFDTARDPWVAPPGVGKPQYNTVIFGLANDESVQPGELIEFSAEDFKKWLFGKGNLIFSDRWPVNETNEVLYSAATDSDHLDDLREKGVKIKNLSLVELGKHRVVEVGLTNLNAPDSEQAARTDALFGVQRLTLSERADEAEFDDDALKAPILIDFGRFAADRPVTEADYDSVDLKGLTHGVTMVGGVIQTATEATAANTHQSGILLGGSLSLITQFGVGQLLGRGEAFDAWNEDTPLTLTGFEKLKGTGFGDTLIFGSNSLSNA